MKKQTKELKKMHGEMVHRLPMVLRLQLDIGKKTVEARGTYAIDIACFFEEGLMVTSHKFEQNLN